MKKLLILSGKGGTGKTTVAAAFIDMLQANAFADCDVDAPNLHIVANLDAVPERKDYYGSQKAIIDMDKCVGCGTCFDTCRFGAITPCDEKYQVDEYACEGCSVCHFVCPHEAVTMVDDIAGEQILYQNGQVFSTAKLKMGRGNSGKLVTEVKATLTKYAQDAKLAIIDGSPGIGCPVIASVTGVDSGAHRCRALPVRHARYGENIRNHRHLRRKSMRVHQQARYLRAAYTGH